MTSSIRVLVIEDDVATLQMLDFLVKKIGCESCLAPDAVVTLKTAHAFPPDLILLDMRLPTINGEQFLNLYRETLGPLPPVIAVSAAWHISNRGFPFGVCEYIAKPFQVSELLDCIKKYSLQTPDIKPPSSK